jgi:hypothetical protein
MSSIFNNIRSLGDARIGGNLFVDGTTTSIDSTVVQIVDNHLYLNKDYTTNVGQSGGIVVNYLPIAIGDTTTSGGFSTTTTVKTNGLINADVAIAGGEFVQVSGSANPLNDGLYEVASFAGSTLTIRSTLTGLNDFSKTEFVVDTTDTSAQIFRVNVSIIRCDAITGVWEVGASADVDTLVFSSLNTSVDLANTVLLAGRTGPAQTINGGTQTAENLIIRANSIDLTTGFVNFSDTQDASVSTNGAIRIAGGVGIAKSLYVGGTINAVTSIKAPVLDTATNVSLAIGGVKATTLSISRTGQTTDVLGRLDVEGVIDTTTASTLSLGTNVATSVEIARAGQTTNVNGSFVVDQATNLGGSATFSSSVFETPTAHAGSGAFNIGTVGTRVNTFNNASAVVALPNASSQGAKYTFVNLHTTGSVTINRSGSDTIGGNTITQIVLSSQHDHVTIQYIGTVWYVV